MATLGLCAYSSTITYDLPFINYSLSFIKGLLDECHIQKLPGIFTTYVSLPYVCMYMHVVCNSMCMLVSVTVCACMCSVCMVLSVYVRECTRTYV